ncbi:MAG: TetR/AcrR family transcriptional regulator [Clostridia bacterium]|nr:TetR/AcrR family transcriptional regulator [Clostridia bacterium]
MKKGIIRRERIIETAEKLFYDKGYEQTSVQDILDGLALSKGGFYHHFESKLQVLEAICAREGERDREAMEQAVRDREGDAVAQLNAIFDRCGLWRRDRMDFAGLMIRVAYRGGSFQLRDAMRRAMTAAALPLLNSVIAAGIGQKVFFTRFPGEIGELILQLFANMTDSIAVTLAAGDDVLPLADILSKLEAYRSSIETLIGAPFGTIALYDLARLPEAVAELAAQAQLQGAREAES